MVKTRQPLPVLLICSLLAVQAAFAQSTLTQIRDTVANADGSPFNGTVVITWNGSTGSNSGTTAPLSTSAHIYSGALSVLLVPTTTASSSSFYQAAYYSNSGLITWTETWQVPPSSTPLTISTVRTSTTQSGGGGSTGGGTGTGGSSGSGGGQYATLPISITQVVSLSADLASINLSIAALTTQLNNLSLTGMAAGTTAAFVDSESPSGTLNGTNTGFTLSHIPSSGSLSVYRNGLLQTPGVDYSVSGSALTFLPASVPRITDTITAYYRIPGSAPLASFTDAETPAGTIDGSNLSFTLATAPSPALSLKLYKNGVLLNQNGDYTLAGNIVSFASAAVTPQPGDLLVASYRH